VLDIEKRSSGNLQPAESHEPGVDLIYDGCGTGATLTINRTYGKALGYSSESTTSVDQCRRDAQSQPTGPIKDIPAGLVLCAITNEDGVAKIIIARLAEPYTEDGAPTLELLITYWAKP
jgi:hypothetical protein